MSERSINTLTHLRGDLEDILAFTNEMTFEDFLHDSKTRKAVSMSLINAGELAKLLDDSIKDKYPHIPWKSIIGMRNIAAHGYHQLNVQTIWETVQMDIAPLYDCVMAELRASF